MVLEKKLPISGEVSVTLTTGDGSATVTFDQPLPSVPKVILGLGEAPTGTDPVVNVYPSSITRSGFTVNVAGTATNSTIKIYWMAL